MTACLAARLNACPVLTWFRIRAATSRLARVVQGRRKHSAMLAPQPNGPLNDAVAVLG
jgi:HAMP domain-containing protein